MRASLASSFSFSTGSAGTAFIKSSYDRCEFKVAMKECHTRVTINIGSGAPKLRSAVRKLFAIRAWATVSSTRQ